MSRVRVPLWITLCACLVTALAVASIGRLQAQGPGEKKEDERPAPSEFPYLPSRYGEAYIPSVADWQAVRLSALGASTTRLTDEFDRQHVTCFVTPKNLFLTLDLAPRPSWRHTLTGGKFSAPIATVKPPLRKAVDETMKFVRNFFSEIRNEDLNMRVYINSEFVGAFEKGELTLVGEKP